MAARQYTLPEALEGVKDGILGEVGWGFGAIGVDEQGKAALDGDDPGGRGPFICS